MKPDVSNREELYQAMVLFYDKIKEDELLSPFFGGQNFPFNWDKHIQMMCSFWENILFFTGDYEGNPLGTHKLVHQKMITQPIHFERWLDLFYEVLETHFEGDNIDKMKGHAQAIAKVMQQQIF